MRLAAWIGVVFCFACASAQAENVEIRQLEAIQLYSQDELLALIQTNSHLRRVQDDDCQLVRDIEARADIMKLPAYQFLWGDMLAYAVCVPRDIERGWQLMQDAAAQGLPAGLEQVGRYYHIGRFVQPDERKAIMYLREAAALGHVAATIRLAEILLSDAGSPRDYEQVYRWLHHSVTADSGTHQKISALLRQFEQKMPERMVLRAREAVR